MSTKPLSGQVAVVAGATRGRAAMAGMPETIEETSELVNAPGGTAVPVRVDHTVEQEVEALFDRVRAEQNGRLDMLVNSLWGGDPLTDWSKRFWKHSLGDGLQIQRQAVTAHMITSYHGASLMIVRRRGLIVEVTDGCRRSACG